MRSTRTDSHKRKQNKTKTREPLTETQTQACILSYRHTSGVLYANKVQGTQACQHTHTHTHLDIHTYRLRHKRLHIQSLSTNKETNRLARAWTHRRPDDCTLSFTSQPKPKNLSPIIWPVLGATGNPELPLSSGGKAGISAISPSLENKSLLALCPPCFQVSWG